MKKKENSNDILKKMYDEFAEQKNTLLKIVEKNDSKIIEIERYLESLFEKEDRDYKVFSPRNVESIYKDKIEKEQTQKNLIENENQNLYKKIAFYMDKMEKLELVMSFTPRGHSVDSKTSIEGTAVLLEMQENDRQRIARDLHDTVVQNLVHLLHKTELASKFMEQDIVRARLELCSVNTVIKESINELRNIIFNLRPMDIKDLGFLCALDRLRDDLQTKADPVLDIKFDLKDISSVEDVILMSIYRIIQECCTNTIKHADAKLLTVKLSEDASKIKLQIKDNGKGFDIDKVRKSTDNSFGLKMAEERVRLLCGRININSNINKGTLIEIEIPYQRKE